MTVELELPSQWTHSIKIEETAKGGRITVHVYATSQTSAIFEAVETYLNTRKECEARGIILAPIEVSKK